MLKTRLVTAGVLVAILVYIFSYASTPLFQHLYVLLTAFAIFLSGTEFAAMRLQNIEHLEGEQKKPLLKAKFFSIGFSYGFFVILYGLGKIYFPDEKYKIILVPIAWLFFCVFLLTTLIYIRSSDMQKATSKIINIMGGFIYIVLPAVCLIELGFIQFEGATHNGHIYFSLATVLMGDTGAYFIGTRFGKTKLIPLVSPKKSVEGAIGGLVFSMITAVFLNSLFNLPFPFWYAIIIGLFMGIAGQIGDLFESALKRAGGYKDSGNLLPGHGGFLDRIDSLLSSIPVALVLFLLYL